MPSKQPALIATPIFGPSLMLLVVLAATRQDAWERFVARSGLGGEVPATYGEAIAAVIAFADPLLSGSITLGRWHPSASEWRAS